MHRYAIGWEGDPYPTDFLVDILVALENLLVRDAIAEVGFKLRVRAVDIER